MIKLNFACKTPKTVKTLRETQIVSTQTTTHRDWSYLDDHWAPLFDFGFSSLNVLFLSCICDLVKLVCLSIVFFYFMELFDNYLAAI